jgi:hypothetical protein
MGLRCLLPVLLIAFMDDCLPARAQGFADEPTERKSARPPPPRPPVATERTQGAEGSRQLPQTKNDAAPSVGANPTVEETIDFLHRVLPQAASNNKITYFNWSVYDTKGVNVRAWIANLEKPVDFRFSVTSEWSYSTAPGPYPEHHYFNLGQVRISEGKSSELLKSDRSTKLSGLLFECEIELSCITRQSSSNTEKVSRLFIPIMRDDVNTRLLKALRHLQSFVTRGREPF